MIILPIVQSVGEAMPGQAHPKLLVMATALMCSGGREGEGSVSLAQGGGGLARLGTEVPQ